MASVGPNSCVGKCPEAPRVNRPVCFPAALRWQQNTLDGPRQIPRWPGSFGVSVCAGPESPPRRLTIWGQTPHLQDGGRAAEGIPAPLQSCLSLEKGHFWLWLLCWSLSPYARSLGVWGKLRMGQQLHWLLWLFWSPRRSCALIVCFQVDI